MKRQTHDVPSPLRWLIILATALVLSGVVGYRPFPAIDDLSKIPRAWAALDPTLYGRDVFIQHYLQHNPLWPGLVWLLQHTVGLAAGLWLLTLLLAVATVAATSSILRTVSGSTWLLPLAAVLALGGVVQGLGRGGFDGVFGAGFHMQWLALCLCLWAYAVFLRGGYWLAGGLIGGVFYVHPVVAAQALGALGFAALFTRGVGVAAMLRVLLPALALASPFMLRLLQEIQPGTALDVPVTRTIRDGYLFRAPHEYALGETPPFLAWLFGVLVAAGFAGLLTPHRRARRADAPARQLAGLMVAHALLLGLAVALHTAWIDTNWPYRWLLPYQLHLTRTTPLLLALAGVALVAAYRPGREKRTGQDGRLRAYWVFYWAMWASLLVVVAVVQVRWQPLVFALLGLALGSLVVGRWLSWPWLAAPWLVLALVAGHGVWTGTRLERVLPPEEAALYAWATTDTGEDALFIVPPGMQDFRFYARRSVYVDFKMFPNAKPALVKAWRERLERVAAPDGLALEGRGYAALPDWDRSYANRNLPSRIADLLQETGADYLVWDAKGLRIPPFVERVRTPDPRLTMVFANTRFKVYRLAAGSGRIRVDRHD